MAGSELGMRTREDEANEVRAEVRGFFGGRGPDCEGHYGPF